ncbi:MAG: cytidine deaminase [bacterium]|uniref:Cytidine deaminase n=2 Tax=Bacteria candidate phyla TaxID=1783234 RepID=A0A101I380_UNCT6|nr:MAG: CMP/dCMP deaminase zinc-binding protein [candidate division TA06 bacterium 32_111]KUK87818.1 MAG: CMP/dCMP deaminase zinc-binding protein [candidate division TA06 bacterium 34_109]MDI6700650.1 cytidine deaminase [bacterium]HAF07971.1 cytidine deaminase [candidate division WOR-3 bacterium]HCP16327.1 cytidine deaminase [candidate division WOR-3 bacterium]
MKFNDKRIILKLKKLSQNSYSKYSKFSVSSILVTKKGKEFYGVNVENASYSLTICAERNAFFSALTSGEKDFKRIYIYANSDKLPFPCGACLQVMSEFVDEDFEIVLFSKKEKREFKFNELLPKRFKL